MEADKYNYNLKVKETIDLIDSKICINPKKIWDSQDTEETRMSGGSDKSR